MKSFIFRFCHRCWEKFSQPICELGHALIFFSAVIKNIAQGKIRFAEVLRQVYEQGAQSLVVIALASLASGVVLALQGYVIMTRFGAKEQVATLVVLSLARELSPVFSALIFSGKAGARMTAELGAMNVNHQITATRVMGVDPIEFLVVPRMLACFVVLPILVVFSTVVGVAGGYVVGVTEGGVSGVFYIHQTLASLQYVDFFSGFIKTFFFAILISWACCYQGFVTKGGSLGVGQYTTKAVALAYILVVVSNAVLTKIILIFWG